MSTNCMRCVRRSRTGPDGLCDECRRELGEMSKTTHITEPWRFIRGGGVEVESGPIARFAIQPDRFGHETRDANAKRAVAAVNACAGLPTEGLEGGVVAELRAACEECLVRLPFYEVSLREQLQAALEKAGEQ